MRRIFTLIISITFVYAANGQPYLIKGAGWQEKIKKNYFLSPLFYGVKKNSIQQENDKKITNNLLLKYGSISSAYRESIITGWNYFYVGKIDSAILNFNQAYLIDNDNLETYFAFGSILSFVNGQPSNELIYKFRLMDKVSTSWGVMAFYGDNSFLDYLKAVQQKSPVNKSLTEILRNPTPPYLIDSGKYIILKIKYDNHEGTYKMGRPSGLWIDYYDLDRKQVMRYYTIVSGKEVGKITAYHKNGKLMSIFNKDVDGDIDGEFNVFDYNGELVRVEYWHKNSHNSKDSKVLKEWEEDGTITFENIDNQSKEFIWKDGKKTLKE